MKPGRKRSHDQRKIDLKNRGEIHSSEPIAVPFERMSFVQNAFFDRANHQRHDQRADDAPHREIQIVETAKT